VDKFSLISDFKRLPTNKNGDSEIKYLFYNNSKFSISIFCQAIGSNSDGIIAAKIAADSIKFHFKKIINDFDPIIELKKALLYAHNNLKIRGQSSPLLTKLATSVSILLIVEKKHYIAHLGDSVIFYKSNSSFKKLTKRHSIADEMLLENRINLTEYYAHPDLFLINKTLNQINYCEPQIETGDYYDGDVFIICSDYVCKKVEESAIRNIALNNDPERISSNLITLIQNYVCEYKNTDEFAVSTIYSNRKLILPNKQYLKNNFLSLFGIINLILFIGLLCIIGYNFLFISDKKDIERRDLVPYAEPKITNENDSNLTFNNYDSLDLDSLNKIIYNSNKKIIR
jgi:protein phosphatase